MPQKTLVIFDLDGTLIDDYQTIAEAFNYAMRRLYHPEQSYETIKYRVGSGHRNLLAPFLASAEELDAAEKFYKERYDQLFPHHARLFPGVNALLTDLQKQGYLLAAASNKIRQYSLAILQHLGIASLFHTIICQDDVDGRLKPDPAMLLTILERMRKTPVEALYVGDTLIDIETGRQANIDTIVVLTGSERRETLLQAAPLALLQSVIDLPAYLESAKDS